MECAEANWIVLFWAAVDVLSLDRFLCWFVSINHTKVNNESLHFFMEKSWRSQKTFPTRNLMQRKQHFSFELNSSSAFSSTCCSARRTAHESCGFEYEKAFSATRVIYYLRWRCNFQRQMLCNSLSDSTVRFARCTWSRRTLLRRHETKRRLDAPIIIKPWLQLERWDWITEARAEKFRSAEKSHNFPPRLNRCDELSKVA